MHRGVLSFPTISPLTLKVLAEISSRASVLSLWSQAICVLGALGRDLQDSTTSCLSQKQFGACRIKYMVFVTLPRGPADWASGQCGHQRVRCWGLPLL